MGQAVAYAKEATILKAYARRTLFFEGNAPTKIGNGGF